MDMSLICGIATPDGEVIKITDSDNVVLWSASKLPSIYQQVEWIKAELDVKAYIDLGFAFDTKAKIYLTQEITSSMATYIFGAAEDSGKYRCMITSPSAGDYKCAGYGSNGDGYITTTTKLVSNSFNEIELNLEKGNGYIYNATNEEKSQVSTAQVSYTMAGKLYLFAQNYNGNTRFAGNNKCLSAFKYYDKNDELICDLVPCYRKSDGVIGMYDIVRKQFLTNVGTGNFIAGPEISVGGGNT